MTYFPVCPADMDDCSKKCRYNYQDGEKLYESKATDCSNPCGCYGSNYALQDAVCKSTTPGPESTVEPAVPPESDPEQQQDPTLGFICNEEGYTLVSMCTTTGTANYGTFGYDCEATNVYVNIPDAVFVDDTDYFPDAQANCRNPFTPVRGFSGIRLEPGTPYANETTIVQGVPRNVNRDTCGNPSFIAVYAQGSDGLVYIGSYFALIYYGPFFTLPTIGSVNAKILTKPASGTQCSTCGGEGQDVCPKWGDAQGNIPRKPIDDLREMF